MQLDKILNFFYSNKGGEEGIDLNGKASLKQDLTEDELEKQKLMQEYKEELAKVSIAKLNSYLEASFQ